jgi:EmrB/QacA subfamily drug resistance transporter
MRNISPRTGAILVLVCLANFVVILDLAIVNVALPSLQRDLAMNPDSLQWVVTAYGLFVGGFMLLGGRLSDVLGRRPMFLSGLGLFVLASLSAGLSSGQEMLIASRAAQGLGAAMLVPAALSTLAAHFREGRERNVALGIFGATGASAGSVGVIAGGLLTDGPGWRWIFLINVPVGLLMVVAALRLLPAGRPHAGGRIDIGGAISATSGLLLLVYALSRGESDGWLAASTVGVFSAAIVLLLAFAWIESRVSEPLVPGSTVRHATRLASNITAFLVFGAFAGFIFAGTLLMQYGMGYSPTRTGVAWLATSLTAFAAAAASGERLVSMFGPRRLITAGAALIAAAGAWLARGTGAESFLPDLLPAFLLAGLGVGFAAPALQIGALTGAAEREEGLASGLVETAREIGSAVGVAAVATALASQVASGQSLPGASSGAAFAVITCMALLGVLVVSLAFPDQARATAAAHQERPGAIGIDAIATPAVGE